MRTGMTVFCALSLASLAASAAAPPPPVEEFTAFPKYDGLAISPGGKHLAVAHREGDNHLLTIVDFPSMASARGITFGDRSAADTLEWLDERTLLVQPSRIVPGFRDGMVNAGEILRADVDTGKSEMIYSYISSRDTGRTLARSREVRSLPAVILSIRSGSPDEVLIQTLGSSTAGEQGMVYRLNVRTGHIYGSAGSPVPNASFVTGPGERVLVAQGTTPDNKLVTYHLETDAQTGKPAWARKSTTTREQGELTPVSWSGTGTQYYALDNRDAPTLGVVMWDAAANTQQLLYRNPDADFIGPSLDPQGKTWLIRGDSGQPFYWYPDPAHPLARMHRALVQGLPPGNHVDVTSQTDDLSIAVVRLSSGQRPPTYVVVDVKSARLLQVMASYPALKPEALAPVEPIEFAARDGLKVRGFLTAPRGANGQRGGHLPMVVSLHGGPHNVYDRSRYDFERQLFASRGYAVLQVNFRGSGGRGREFEAAGYGQWGRAMQDDVTDAVRWAIAQGIADPARICVFGGSYGAYSALIGAAREPDLFKCAIGLSGVYDLPLMFDKGDIQFQQRGRAYLAEELGKDMDDLRDRSPVYHAADIKAKVMLLHGADDARAPLEHAQRMRKALVDAGNPPEWIVETGEAHGFFDPQNRAAAYTRILAFIEQNIGK
ncbi:MAG: hypothetical protein RL030_2063 [Pseudomonadota bacterium]